MSDVRHEQYYLSLLVNVDIVCEACGTSIAALD